ncbi:glycosyltransferase family 4 protein [Candidatus Fermentibacteria bacterium]|nr:glycosyltransferase family 4 protein [Candidatus Fermentibacteria bacterium]
MRGRIPQDDGGRRLRVLFIPEWYPPREGQQTVSGAFVREHVLAASLHDDVSVLLFRTGERGKRAVRLEEYADSGVEIIDFTAFSPEARPPRTLKRRLMWLWLLARAIGRWGRPDLIHCQDKSVFHAAPAARLLGVPYVMSSHWTGFMRRDVTPEEVQGFRRLVPGAALVLCSNAYAREDFEHYGIQGRFEWLPNSFDPDVFHPVSGLPKTENLVHVSGFTDQKRAPDILRAFAIVLRSRPSARLLMVGNGIGRAATEDLASRLLPPGSFEFPGFVPKTEIADILRRCRGFVFPSSAETFGCALMEAMACGCPVLTTRVGGIPHVAREGEGIFVEAGDIGAIAEGMIALLDGTHGLDTDAVARSVLERFGRPAVGRIIHCYHLAAVSGSNPENHRKLTASN